MQIVDGFWIDNYVEATMVMQNGNIMVIWVEDVAQSGTLRYNFITTDGELGSNGVQGGYILDNTGDPEKLELVELNNGDAAIVAWEELRNFSKDIYVNKIYQDGTLESNTGVAVTSADNDQSNIIIEKGYENIFVVWEDFENGVDFNITGQFISFDLDLIGDPILVCHEDLFQGSPAMVYDGLYIVAWEDERGFDNGDPVLSGGFDIYLQGVTESGELLYQEGGVPIVSEYHNQSSPQFELLSFDINMNPVWLLHWVDMRSSGKADLKNLYAQGLESIGAGIDDEVVPSEFKVSSAYPNPFNSTVVLDIEIAEVEPVSFSITNILGQLVYQQILLPTHAGKFQISWNGKDLLQKELPSGIYIYTIKSSGNIASGKFTYLK